MPQFIVHPDCPAPLEQALRSAVFEYSMERKKFLKRFEGQYDEEFSITDLPLAPKQLWLKRKWWDDIRIDLVRDNYSSLLGQIVHFILEHHAPPNCVVEERQHTFITVAGVRVLFHGKPDLYDPKDKRIDDYKFCSAISMLYEKWEYEFQLNAGAWLFQNRGLDVSKLKNIFLFKELNAAAADKIPNYPQENIAVRKFTPWPRSVTEGKIKQLIARQLQYKHTHWKKLPDCTDAERWLRDSNWGVFKRVKPKRHQRIGDWSKLAAKRFSTEKEAQEYADLHTSMGIDTEIKKKVGTPKKCDKYCPVVGWCAQRQNELKLKEKKVLVDE
jgi:hypothetical protein